MDPGQPAQRRHPALGLQVKETLQQQTTSHFSVCDVLLTDTDFPLQDVHPAGQVRRARRSCARDRVPPAAAALRLRRRRLQDQGQKLNLFPNITDFAKSAITTTMEV